MLTVGVHEAKSTLSKLIRRSNAGEEIIITRDGKPVARLVGIAPDSGRRLGCDVGLFDVPEDFDAPLPDAVLDAFEG